MLLPFAIPGVATVANLGAPFFYLMMDALYHSGPLPRSLEAVNSLLISLYNAIP
jgi:hypothetical protein